MKLLAMLAMTSLLGIGCSKTDDHAATKPASAPAPSAAAPAAPAEPVAPTAAPTPKPLSHYLASAATAQVFAIKLKPGGGADKTVIKTLDAAATKAYLAGLDLSQLADGPLARCPSDTVVEFADASGAPLGTIGFCQAQAASFSATDGTTGGIRATAP
ncbi:MAG: hypothetical protein R3B06_22970 [Kofleriaceae bacterium]